MSLSDIFKNNNMKSTQFHSFQQVNKATNDPKNNPNYFVDASSISQDERPYYKPDSYYTYYSYPGTMVATRVVPFDERKMSIYPSARGLYVAEIMLLEYCNSGKYPKPKEGYPAFWWFKYGIRDVGRALQSLHQRGFIQWGTKYSALKGLKHEELKQILSESGLSTMGKKAELIDRIKNNISEQVLSIPNYTQKYELTEIGKQELEDNGYIPYMHNHRHLTNEDNRFGDTFTVWDINRLFPDGNAINWRSVVGSIELERFGVNMANADSINTNSSLRESNNVSYSKEGIRRYLSEKRNEIYNGINTPGNGFEEEFKGLDYKSIGNDKDALVMFYISIGKRFDAPALYRETKKILRKYNMLEEELLVIDAEMRYVNNCNKTDLLQRKNEIYKMITEKKEI
ncbi:MAG: SAP domain-containing protein [Lachnospiraceae bacterium]|nr:SAP domain-containing protein [Lachnospiraceae bacterium]